jgi:hypothetical protein
MLFMPSTVPGSPVIEQFGGGSDPVAPHGQAFPRRCATVTAGAVAPPIVAKHRACRPETRGRAHQQGPA